MATAVTDWGFSRPRPPTPEITDGITEGYSTAITEWNPSHTHPHWSWWQYRNDREVAMRMFLGLSVMAVIGVILTVWAVMAA